jgi:hypothetical protein
MYQAGVKNITLYENKGIDFSYWDALDLRQISNIVSSGAIIQIENMQRPEFDIEQKLKGGKMGHDYSFKFLLLGLTLDNYDMLNQIMTSIYGWCFLVEFYSGEFRFYNTPIFCLDGKIKPHNEMSIEVNMKNPVHSLKSYFEYTPGISGTQIFRWDSENLTWDSEIYTFDYEL